jgi:hypothetical protein
MPNIYHSPLQTGVTVRKTSEHPACPYVQNRAGPAVRRCCRIPVRLGYRPHHRCVRRALGNRPSAGLRWHVKNSWWHDHDLPSSTHSHSRPATRPEQRPLVQIHLQLVAELWVLAIFVCHIKSGIGTPTGWTLPVGTRTSHRDLCTVHA